MARCLRFGLPTTRAGRRRLQPRRRLCFPRRRLPLPLPLLLLRRLHLARPRRDDPRPPLPRPQLRPLERAHVRRILRDALTAREPITRAVRRFAELLNLGLDHRYRAFARVPAPLPAAVGVGAGRRAAVALRLPVVGALIPSAGRDELLEGPGGVAFLCQVPVFGAVAGGNEGLFLRRGAFGIGGRGGVVVGHGEGGKGAGTRAPGKRGGSTLAPGQLEAGGAEGAEVLEAGGAFVRRGAQVHKGRYGSAVACVLYMDQKQRMCCIESRSRAIYALMSSVGVFLGDTWRIDPCGVRGRVFNG